MDLSKLVVDLNEEVLNFAETVVQYTLDEIPIEWPDEDRDDIVEAVLTRLRTPHQ